MKSWFFFLGFFVLASEAAASGMLVYGYAYVDGGPMPSGSVVTAMVADSVVGGCSVGDDGLYSVFVRTNRSEYSPVEFYVGWGKATQVVPFVGYGVMEIDLDFEPLTETTTTLYHPPAVTGGAVSVTISDNVLTFGIIALLVVIVYSIKDILMFQ
ncbi:MAG: hypothetical protein JW778_01650 [Candidatus Altiarchaeota archaeon]|nr:hypothetical protein [Candidatus Altiarchaeota archaeon]